MYVCMSGDFCKSNLEKKKCLILTGSIKVCKIKPSSEKKETLRKFMSYVTDPV